MDLIQFTNHPRKHVMKFVREVMEMIPVVNIHREGSPQCRNQFFINSFFMRQTNYETAIKHTTHDQIILPVGRFVASHQVETNPLTGLKEKVVD